MVEPGFEEHAHDKLVHSHPHYHVTHNYSETARTFEHLSSQHEHEHDHPAITHAHLPHQDFDSEHGGEAHVHDHGEPVAKREPAKKTATKKAAGKKATAKKTT